MEWTKQDRERLLSFKSTVDSDDIKVKEQIKKVLLTNKYIAHILDNKELEEKDSEIDEYFGISILPYYMIPTVQSSVKNFICYEVDYDELNRYNSSVKVLQIVFTILCHQSEIIDRETGIARHDLLAALIQDQFNYTNFFGRTIQLVSDKATTTDTSYACRTLIFEQTTDNNLVKTRNNISRLSNKDVVTLDGI